MGHEISTRRSVADDPNIVQRIKSFQLDLSAERLLHEYMEEKAHHSKNNSRKKK